MKLKGFPLIAACGPSSSSDEMGLVRPASVPLDGPIVTGRRFNGFLGLSLNDGTILFLAILLDKTVSVGQDSLCIRTLAFYPA